MSDAQAKNAQAMLATLKALRFELEKHSDKIAALERTVTMQGIQIEKQREQITVALVARGTGPTAR